MADWTSYMPLHAAGLRSLGPVWSRPNAFGHGVPFLCPSSPDTGPGLTDLGKELGRRCNQLRILIDLSHINERGFWDVAGTACPTERLSRAKCPHLAEADSPSQSTLVPVVLTTLPHFSVSSAISFPNSTGDPGSTAPP